jgi:AraC-like DNA-binding protein
MKNCLYDHGYGVEWNERYVYSREGYITSVLDFHEHDFYEVNLILSGNVRILFPDRVSDDTESCIVLSRPGTPHFISCQPDTLYSRLYLCFSHEFVADFSMETRQLLGVFAKNGTVIHLSAEQRELCRSLILQIKDEEDRLRQRLLIFLLLSKISDFAGNRTPSFVGVPPYVINTLTYIDEYFSEKITAESLARKLNIGRTTLMTGFKHYTGNTLNDYLVNVRLRNAIHLLREGLNVQETADRCGFGDSSSFIRSFKKEFGTTPRQYLLDHREP